MTRRGIGFAVALFLAGWLGSPARSYAYSRNFQIFNDTTSTIQSVWTSAYGDKYWHMVRGLNDLAPGNQSKVVFNQTGPCIVQLRVKINGRNYDWRNGFNLCSVSTITIYYNSASGTYSARYQ